MSAPPLPTFSALMMEQCAPHLHKINIYAEVLLRLGEMEDADGFLRASTKMLNEARAFAKLVADMKRSPARAAEVAAELKAAGQ